MKSLRRSLNRDPPPISTPLSTYPQIAKPIPFAAPPKKVVRCIRPYRSTNPQELSAVVGDFLYVVRDLIRDDGAWYEVTNPTNGSRGIVPQECFEELQKSQPARCVLFQWLIGGSLITISHQASPQAQAHGCQYPIFQDLNQQSQQRNIRRSTRSSSTISSPNDPTNLMPGQANLSPS